MTANETQPSAAVKPASRFSKVWFIPAVAVLIGIWMVVQQWANQETKASKAMWEQLMEYTVKKRKYEKITMVEKRNPHTG